jgi:hypothetical protein
MSESAYQKKVIKKLKLMFPGCVIHKNDPTYMQGVPDLVIYFGQRWAMLEVKASSDSKEQPNQRYYVKKFNDMSFAAFIHPDNEAEVLDELQHALDPFG